jgi:hypothetical protein
VSEEGCGVEQASEKSRCESNKSRYSERFCSFSNGIVIGTQIFVEKVQELLGRKFIRGRNLIRDKEVYGSRRFCTV